MCNLMKRWGLLTIVAVSLIGSSVLAKNKGKGGSSRPSGWNRGQKKGWTADVPPGIEKKGDWLPSGLRKKEETEVKESNVPGWSPGKKEGESKQNAEKEKEGEKEAEGTKEKKDSKAK